MSSISADPCIVFETKRTTRFFDKALALVLGLGACSLALLVPTAVSAMAFFVGCPLPISVTLGFALGAYLMWLTWQIVAERLRFCLVFHPSFLQVGRGLVRSDYPYDGIEEVALPTQFDEAYGIGVRSGKMMASVYLTPDDSIRCFDLLKHTCRYAVFVDDQGKEHFPVSTDRPERAIRNRERFHRRICIGTILALPGLLINNLSTVTLILGWYRGEIVMRNSEVVRECVVGTLYLACTLAFIAGACLSFSKARRARRERFAIAAERMTALTEGSKDDGVPTSSERRRPF